MVIINMPEMKCHREVKGREALYKKLETRIQEEKHWIPSKRRFLSMGSVSSIFTVSGTDFDIISKF